MKTDWSQLTSSYLSYTEMLKSQHFGCLFDHTCLLPFGHRTSRILEMVYFSYSQINHKYPVTSGLYNRALQNCSGLHKFIAFCYVSNTKFNI